jgi:hypothetical protein
MTKNLKDFTTDTSASKSKSGAVEAPKGTVQGHRRSQKRHRGSK